MLNEKMIKREIIERFQSTADEISERYRLELERSFPQYRSEAGTGLLQAIESAGRKYQKAENAGETGPLEWIWLSFLRSSLLDDAPCYRIDLYDAKGRLSEGEYAEMWDYSYVFQPYYEIEKKIMDLNDILSRISVSFRKTADRQIIQIFHSIHLELVPMAAEGKSLKIMLGDYMDEAELIDEVWYGEMEERSLER